METSVDLLSDQKAETTTAPSSMDPMFSMAVQLGISSDSQLEMLKGLMSAGFDLPSLLSAQLELAQGSDFTGEGHSDLADPQYSTDEFRMYSFKVSHLCVHDATRQ